MRYKKYIRKISQVVLNVTTLPVICQFFGARPDEILAIKTSTGGFYDKVKSTTRIIVFDDFSPDARSTQEFLRLCSASVCRDLNVKFGTVTVTHLCVIVVVNNLSPLEFIEKSNQIQADRKQATTNPQAFLRRFTNMNMNEENFQEMRTLFPRMEVKETFMNKYHELFTKFVFNMRNVYMFHTIVKLWVFSGLWNQTEL